MTAHCLEERCQIYIGNASERTHSFIHASNVILWNYVVILIYSWVEMLFFYIVIGVLLALIQSWHYQNIYPACCRCHNTLWFVFVLALNLATQCVLHLEQYTQFHEFNMHTQWESFCSFFLLCTIFVLVWNYSRWFAFLRYLQWNS